MKKYVFLIFFTLFWAILCPFAAFKILCGSFVPSVSSLNQIDHSEEYSSFHSISESNEESVIDSEDAEKDIINSENTKKEILISKEELKVAIAEICPTAVFEENKIIKAISYDNENRCKYITAGNCAISAQCLADKFNFQSLAFQIHEDETSITFVFDKNK
jgi:hypothetical protein